MSNGSLLYGVGQGIRSIFRNRIFSLASVATMAACLFLFCVFDVVLDNFKYIVLEAEENVGVTVFFEEGVTDSDIVEIGDAIKKRAEVARVEYTSAEQAWADYKADNLTEELAASFGDDNPLAKSASYTVYLGDVSMQSSLVRYIKSLKGVRKVNDASEIADSLSGINEVITVVSAIIIVVLLLVSVFLISITISTGIAVRKTEISIMKLIGASNYFIRVPFIVEGIIIGLTGAAIPLLTVGFSYDKVVEKLMSYFAPSFTLPKFVPAGRIMVELIPICLLIGLGVGFVGSNLTLRKQLRKIDV